MFLLISKPLISVRYALIKMRNGLLNQFESSMESKFLLESEVIITQSDENLITLTNRRLRYSKSEFNKAHIVSILLQHISSIEVRYSAQILYLIIGIGCIVFGIGMLMAGTSDYGLIAIAGGLGLVATYLSSRRYFIIVSSNGGSKINFHTKDMKRDVVLDFINKIERAIIENQEKSVKQFFGQY